MLLSKILCLDKGYVALISSSNTSKVMVDLKDEFFKVDTLSPDDTLGMGEIANMTVAIKCPLFVQLNLTKFGFRILTGKTEVVEAYVPNETEVKSPDLQINRDIAAVMKQSTEALLLNPLAMQKDGADKFISQVMTPISVYNTLIVHGTLNQWMAYGKQVNLPAPIEAYRDAISDILVAEWKFV